MKKLLSASVGALALCIYLLLSAAGSQAQPLQVTVTVTPPYSVHLSDYVYSGDNVLILVTNLSRQEQQCKLIPTVTGDNGVSVTIEPDFQPVAPIVVPAFGTISLTLQQLQQYNANLSESDVDITGYSTSLLLQTESLPEGNYTLCVRAFDYSTGGQLSNDFGCAMFPVTHFDPPWLIAPADASYVAPQNPQLIVFTWTPSGQPGNTRYLFELIDMTYNGLADANDAFTNPAVQKFVVQDIITSTLVYDLSYPPLNEGHRYAVRITAYDPFGNLAWKNGGRSPVSTFRYEPEWDLVAVPVNPPPAGPGDLQYDEGPQVVQVDLSPNDFGLLNPPQQQQQQPVIDPEDSPGCLGDCMTAAPANSGNVSVQPGDEVIIGKFKMTVVSVQGNNSGTGEIFINWLKTPVSVQFNNISVNDQMQLYAGEVFARVDGGNIPEALAKSKNANLSQLGNQLGAISNFVNQAGRRVSNFAPDNDLPIGVPFTLDNAGFDLAIVGLVFEPTSAFMNAVLPVQIPESIDAGFLSIHASGICIRPNGLGAAGKITLSQDVTLSLSEVMDMKFNHTSTYLDFDCSGVTKARVDGQLVFDRDILLPVVNGEVQGGNAKVTASFAVDMEQGHNWMLDNVNLSPANFTTPATRGFIFTASGIKFDHSDLANPPGMQNAFPENYPNTGPTWKGLYIGQIGCQLPDGFQQGNDPLSVQANHLLIDKHGFSGGIAAQNLIDFGSGKLDGWKFSIDAFELEILNSGLQSGGFAGQLRLPISETALGYDVVVSAPQNENASVDFEFVLEDLPDLDVEVWQAQMALENSTVSITKQGDAFKVGAILNGSISIGWGKQDNLNNSSASSFSLPSVEFSGLEIGGGQTPSIQNGSFGIVNNNEQAQCATFPITLSEIQFQFNGPEVGIKFVELGFTLANMQNGLSGSADFTIVGKWNGVQGLFEYDRTQLNSIHVDADLVAAHVVGSIDIYQEDPTYGNGFRGHVEATINMTGTAIELTLQAGKTIGNDPFRYFYFDGLVDLGDFAGIPLGATGVALYGFGGGMWYNMSRSSQFSEDNPLPSDEYDGGGYSEQVGTSESGVVYTPSKNKAGFSAAVLFGIYQARNVFNGDLEFGMQMDVADLSLELVWMAGNGYVMQSPTGDRTPENSLIAAFVNIEIDPQKPMFHCVAGISISLGGIVEGGATISMHYETLANNEKLWYMKVGSWNEQSTYAQDYPWEDDMRFHVGIDLVIVEAVFHGYFMVGNDIPGLPPLPKVIRDNLGLIQDDRDPLMGNNPAMGLAMGAGLYVHVGFEFAIFYADVTFAFGADVIIKDFGSVECGDIDPIGINGWYAKGQAYAHFHGEAGLFIDLWFFSGKASLLELSATAAMFAQGPNPMYAMGLVSIEGSLFNGLIKVNTQFKVEAGEKCDLPEYNPFDDIPIVSQVLPGDGETNVYTGTDMQVAFNFPQSEFTIEEYDEEGEVTIRKFKYEIKQWELKHGNTVLPWQTHAYAADGYSRKSVQKDYMPGESTIKYYLLVKGYETTSGKVEKASQVYQGSFQTGERPKIIEASNVLAMQPLGGKRYVLQEEYNEGWIKLKKGQGYLFSAGSLATGTNAYKAKFKALKLGQVTTETNVTWQDAQNRVQFGMPHNLANEQIYGVEIVRRHTPPISDFAAATNTVDKYNDFYVMGGPGGKGIQGMQVGNIVQQPPPPPPANLNQFQVNQGGIQQMFLNGQLAQQTNQGVGQVVNLPLLNNAPPQPPGNNWQINNGYANPGNNGGNNTGPTVKIQVLNRELLESTETEKEEFALYTYYWRTSKYNSWDDKLDDAEFLNTGAGEQHGFQTEWKGSNAVTQTEINVVYLELDENIDRYDAYGFTYQIGNNSYPIAPGLQFTFNYGQNWLADQWYDGYIYPWDAPDPEDWGNPIVLLDEYNEPVQYYLNQFPDFDAYWPDKFLHWTEDRFTNRLKGNVPFAKRDYPVPQEYKGWEQDPPVVIYNQYQHGIFNLQQQPTMPAANLSMQEVQAAMAQAPNPNQSPPWQTLQVNLGNNFPNMGMNVYAQVPPKSRIPILEYQDFLADHDFQWMKDFIITGLLDELDNQSQGTYWNFHDTVYEPILFFISHPDFELNKRPGMVNYMKVNGRELEYKTKL